MANILITGATGLLGAQVAKILCGIHRIFAIVRQVPTTPILGVEYIELDLTHALAVDKLPQKLDALIHLSQSEYIRGFPEKALDLFDVNVGATARLLDYAKSARATQFILASTGGLYSAQPEPISECQPTSSGVGPLAYYFGCKKSAELLAIPYRSHMNVAILRPFFIYGKNQRPSMLISRLIENVRCGGTIEISGANGPLMNPVFVEDAALAVKAAMEVNLNEAINVAGPQILSIRKICELIGDAVGKEPNFKTEPGTPQNFIGDIAKLRGLINDSLTPFDQGVYRVLQERPISNNV